MPRALSPQVRPFRRLSTARRPSRSVTRHRVQFAVPACARTATAAKAANPMSGPFHWQTNPDLILIGHISPGQKGWGLRDPEPTD
jgi:hypothetical protein